MTIPRDQWQKWLSTHSTEVRNRIDRLNPDGCEEGFIPRGWHPHRRSTRWDCVSVIVFIAKHGRDAYRGLPSMAFMRDGNRKSLRRDELMKVGYL